MALDLVVVNYRTPQDLKEFFQSFFRNPPSQPWRGWVVNNDPNSEDLEVANKSSWQQVVHDNNIGYAKAINHAVSLGNGDVVGVFNADTEFTEGAIDDCVKALTSHQDWGALGPRQINQDGRITAGGIFGTNTHPKHRGWHSRDSEEFGDVRESVTVSGSALFFKRKVWNELFHCQNYQEAWREVGSKYADGAFLETPLFYEETHFCYHLRNHGYKAIYYGPVTMVHKWHRSVKKNGQTEATRKFKESKELFGKTCDLMGIAHD